MDENKKKDKKVLSEEVLFNQSSFRMGYMTTAFITTYVVIIIFNDNPYVSKLTKHIIAVLASLLILGITSELVGDFDHLCVPKKKNLY